MRLSFETLESRDVPATFTPKVPVELWQQLATDVRAIVATANPPSQESIQTLVSTVQTAAADGVITNVEKARITVAANNVLASANITVEQIQVVVVDVQLIVEARQA